MERRDKAIIQWLVVRWNYPSRRCKAQKCWGPFHGTSERPFVLDHFWPTRTFPYRAHWGRRRANRRSAAHSGPNDLGGTGRRGFL